MADGIFEQLRRESEPPASVRIAGFSSHNLTAVVREVFRGKMSGAEATAALGLTAQSIVELQAVAAEITAGNLKEAEVFDNRIRQMTKVMKHHHRDATKEEMAPIRAQRAAKKAALAGRT